MPMINPYNNNLSNSVCINCVNDSLRWFWQAFRAELFVHIDLALAEMYRKTVELRLFYLLHFALVTIVEITPTVIFINSEVVE